MDKRLNNAEGYFDVRLYNAKKQRKDWDLKSETDTIAFSVRYKATELPQELSNFAKVYDNKNGEKMAMAVFKISPRCKWFGRNEAGRFAEMPKPTNEELDGQRYKVAINYRELNGDPAAKEACGYWANGICIIKQASSNMFDDLNDQPTPLSEIAEMPPMPAVEEQKEEKLPF